MIIGTKNEKTDRYRDVVIRVVKKIFDGNVVETIDALPYEIFPEGSAPKNYATLEEEYQVIKNTACAVLGKVPESSGEKGLLSEIAKEYINHLPKQYEAGLTVTNSACNKCTHEQYVVSSFCRSCVARPCAINCPKKCISFPHGQAFIDQSKCIKCGTCARVCPFTAISKLTRPCADQCPVSAISLDAEGFSVIDQNKCIHCGRCIVRCPFGAIHMSSHLGAALQAIQQGKHVVAMFAPATLGQFNCTPAQLQQAALRAGFHEAVEVSLGADLTSINDATEFLEIVGGGRLPLMTTSCCPAFVRAITTGIPSLLPYVSGAGSPMKYVGDLVKHNRKDVLTCFVGPCTAKRTEVLRHPNTDYAITNEELYCIFLARGIDPTKMEDKDPGTTRLGSKESANYCLTQMVTEAVVHALPLAIEGVVHEKDWGGVMHDGQGADVPLLKKDTDLAAKLATESQTESKTKEGSAPVSSGGGGGGLILPTKERQVELKPVAISPLTADGVKQLRAWGTDPSKCEGNLIECMCCAGGCIGGPGNIVAPTVGAARIKAKIIPTKPAFSDIEDITVIK